MVIWKARLKSGEVVAGSCLDDSWSNIRHRFESNPIEELSLIHESQKKFSVTGENEGFFLGRKIIASTLFNGSFHIVGIGHLNKESNFIEIKWFDVINFDLLESEERSIEDSGFFYLKNGKC